MKLTAFTDYSLRVLIFMAAQPQKRATIAQVAAAYQVSENHLVKVVHFLGRQSWLRNVRGKGGGLELAQEPSQVVLGQVVRRTQGEDVVAECFEGSGGCCIAPHCRLRGVLVEAVEAFHAVLDRHTLANLVSNREELAQLLFMDRTDFEERPHDRSSPASGSRKAMSGDPSFVGTSGRLTPDPWLLASDSPAPS